VEKKPEEKKKSPSPLEGAAPEFVERFPDTVSFDACMCTLPLKMATDAYIYFT